MAAVAPPVNENVKPSSPVDLSTIPISPDGDKADDTNNSDKDEEQITVFHDKDNFNVKHPLMHKWTLWFTKPPSGKVCLIAHCFELMELTLLQGDNWNDLLKEVITFNSVEEFWGVYVCQSPTPPYLTPTEPMSLE